jgi:hypothetical protein
MHQIISIVDQLEYQYYVFAYIMNKVLFENLNVYMKLFLLLYADDTVIFAESQQELQQILKLSEHYCSIWKLKVNV